MASLLNSPLNCSAAQKGVPRERGMVHGDADGKGMPQRGVVSQQPGSGVWAGLAGFERTGTVRGHGSACFVWQEASCTHGCQRQVGPAWAGRWPQGQSSAAGKAAGSRSGQQLRPAGRSECDSCEAWAAFSAGHCHAQALCRCNTVLPSRATRAESPPSDPHHPTSGTSHTTTGPFASGPPCVAWGWWSTALRTADAKTIDVDGPRTGWELG